MGSISEAPDVTVGVLALQGAFSEHLQLLRQAEQVLAVTTPVPRRKWVFLEVRTEAELALCDALVIPGGESTAISLVAERSNMLDPLRDFVKQARKPTWGTCAGLILLAESANRTKKGGQELIGGLDVRVNRNHFGRQTESFQANLDLDFLKKSDGGSNAPFRAIFIRAPVVERLLPHMPGVQEGEAETEETVIAPSRSTDQSFISTIQGAEVEVMAILPGRTATLSKEAKEKLDSEAGDIVAVRQANVFGTSFHPELTGDPRIHTWWLEQVVDAVEKRRALA
ncbi:pyridoxine [Coleophoma crateriformis]|uniref:glutaminase n=1 Tax=Coleophoma crateriformis TaxID=565419 RepID=A0A3D8QUC6_9HELO|nr:pyridoxine [Coleophoma crateriformis]